MIHVLTNASCGHKKAIFRDNRWYCTVCGSDLTEDVEQTKQWLKA